jgi:hypothetical protein
VRAPPPPHTPTPPLPMQSRHYTDLRNWAAKADRAREPKGPSWQDGSCCACCTVLHHLQPAYLLHKRPPGAIQLGSRPQKPGILVQSCSPPPLLRPGCLTPSQCLLRNNPPPLPLYLLPPTPRSTCLPPPPRPSATPPPSEYPCHPSLAACVLPYLQPAASLPAPPAVRQAHACPGRHRGPLSLAGLDAEEPHQPLDLCADTHAKSLGRHLSSGLSLFNPPGLCANTNAKGFGRHLGLG